MTDNHSGVFWFFVLFTVVVLIAVGIALWQDRPSARMRAPTPLRTEEDKERERLERRRRAKQLNERAKLFASFLSSLGVAFLIAVAVVPVIQRPNEAVVGLRSLVAVGVAIMLHMFGQLVLNGWKSED